MKKLKYCVILKKWLPVDTEPAELAPTAAKVDTVLNVMAAVVAVAAAEVAAAASKCLLLLNDNLINLINY